MSDYHIDLAGIGQGARFASTHTPRVGSSTFVPASAVPSPRVSSLHGMVTLNKGAHLYQPPATIKAKTPAGWWTNLSEDKKKGTVFVGAVVLAALAYHLYQRSFGRGYYG